jgi:hypothetical protein
MRILTSSVAILALAATGAIAQGNGKGNGQGNGGNDRGGPPAAAQAGPDAKGNRGNGNNKGNGNAERGGPPVQAERGNGNAGNPNARNGNGNGNGNAGVRTLERGNGQGAAKQIERDLRGNNGNGNGNRNAANNRGNGANDGRILDRTLDRTRDHYIQTEGRYGGTFGYAPSVIDGCPPGLAKKNNGCQPPGLARQRAPYGSIYQPSLFGLYSPARRCAGDRKPVAEFLWQQQPSRLLRRLLQSGRAAELSLRRRCDLSRRSDDERDPVDRGAADGRSIYRRPADAAWL